MKTKPEKNQAASALGKLGGAARAKNKKGMRAAQQKGWEALSRRFKTPEEKSAYFRGIRKKGIKAKKIATHDWKPGMVTVNPKEIEVIPSKAIDG